MASGGCGRPCLALGFLWLLCAVLSVGGWMTFSGLVVTSPGDALPGRRAAAESGNSSRKRAGPVAPAAAARFVGLYPLVQRGGSPVYMLGLGAGAGAPDGSALGSASISLLGDRKRARGAASPFIVTRALVAAGSPQRVWALMRLSGEDQLFVQPKPDAVSPGTETAGWCCGAGSPSVTAFGPPAWGPGAAGAGAGAGGAGKPTAADQFAKALAGRPVDCAVMALCLWLYFRQSTGKVRVDDVAISARSAVGEGQGWRAVTSALSHGSIMHVGFNMMTLYQLKPLEPGLGSARYAATSLALVVLTSAVACALQLCAARLCRRPGAVDQRAVGYSAVLFAWVVVAASQLGEFCPLPFAASVCLPTWSVPLPWGASLPGLPASLAVNLAPFVMLALMQVAVPNVSFSGHLAGILVGYPVAWGALDWAPAPAVAAGVLPLAVAWGAECFAARWGLPEPEGGAGGAGGGAAGARRAGHGSDPAGWTPRASLHAAPGVPRSASLREAAAAAGAAEAACLASLVLAGLGVLVRRYDVVAWDIVTALAAVALAPAWWRLAARPDETAGGETAARDSPLVAASRALGPWGRAAALLSGEVAATSAAALALLSVAAATSTAAAAAVLAEPLAELSGGRAAVWGGLALAVLSALSNASLAVSALRLLGWANASGPVHVIRCAWGALGAAGGTAAAGAGPPATDGAVWRKGLPPWCSAGALPRGCRRGGGGGGGGGGEEEEDEERRGLTAAAAAAAPGVFQGRGVSLSGRAAP